CKAAAPSVGVDESGPCRPMASNQPIWPRLATMTVAPGRVPLSTSRLKVSDIRCSRAGDSASDSGFARGKGGVWGTAAGLVAVCAVMVSPVALVTCLFVYLDPNSDP